MVEDQLRVENFQAGRQHNALLAGDGLHFFGFGQQYAARDAALLADRGRADGAWLVAFRQHDALVGLLCTADQLIAERRRRQAQLAAWHAEARMQQLGLQVLGDEIGNLAGALDIVGWRFLVQGEQIGGGVVGAGLYRHDRQAAIERGLAQLENARVRSEVAAQQQSGQLDAIERGQARGEDNVVTITGRDDQNAGFQQLHGIGDGAGAQDDLADPTALGFAGMQHLGIEQLGDIPGAQGVQALGVRDGAEQLEVLAAE